MYELDICLDIYSIFVEIQAVKLIKWVCQKQIVSSVTLEIKICAKFFCWEALTIIVSSLDYSVTVEHHYGQ